MALNGIRVYDILNPNNTELINSSRKAEIKSLMKNILLSTEKTESNEEEEIKLKKVEIESFIAELETVQNSGVHSMSLLQGKKIEINNFYEKQSLKNEENFQNIFESLELCKKNICEKIKSSKEENEFLINNYHNQISNSLKDMNYIHSDISQNFESIIKNMDRKPFTIILNKYYQKLKSFEMIYQNLNKERIILNPSQLSLKNLPGKQFKLNEEICKLINPVFGKILSDSTSKKNENNVYISFDDKDAFEKSPASLDKHLIKTEKNTPNKCLYANISEKENLNSPNTEKYLKLLQKVNNNQENTNIFYNDHIKSQQLKSSESCKILKMSGEKKNDEKNFHKFFSKIEKNLDKNEIKINNAYQKHLFCSPHFKENSDLII